jgi:cell division protease FtsH
MSRLGRVFFREQNGSAFLPGGPVPPGDREYSEQTAREIDLEVRKILDNATDEVRGILESRKAALTAVAERLVEREVIDGAELRDILERHIPGPHLVPGSLARPVAEEPVSAERKADTPISAGAGLN